MRSGLADILRVLWSVDDGRCRVVETSDTRSPGPEQTLDRLLVVPGRGPARYVVSDAPGKALSRMLTSHNALRSRRRATGRTAAALAVRTPLTRRVGGRPLAIVAPAGASPADLVFASHLRGLLDAPRALTAVGVRERSWAHSKPVLQLFDERGRPLAYSKLGWSESTAPLVRHEAETLRRVAAAGTGPVARPALVAEGTWGGGHPFLVVEPLPADIAALQQGPAPEGASAGVAGPLVRLDVLASPWWAELSRRAEALDRDRPLAGLAHRAVEVLAGRLAGRAWEFGAWHGDWTWWNTGRSGSTLWAWDWEHWAPSAPYGFDDLHWSVSLDRQVRGLPLRDAARAAGGGAHRAQADVTGLVDAYLAELAVRSAEVSAGRGGPELELLDGLGTELTARLADSR